MHYIWISYIVPSNPNDEIIALRSYNDGHSIKCAWAICKRITNPTAQSGQPGYVIKDDPDEKRIQVASGVQVFKKTAVN